MVTRDDEIEVVGRQGKKLLFSNVHGWCEVAFQNNLERLSLGYQTWDYLSEKLTAFFLKKSATQTWVLSLSEIHTSFYGDILDKKSRLSFQNEKGILFSSLEIDNDTILNFLKYFGTKNVGEHQ